MLREKKIGIYVYTKVFDERDRIDRERKKERAGEKERESIKKSKIVRDDFHDSTGIL